MNGYNFWDNSWTISKLQLTSIRGYTMDRFDEMAFDLVKAQASVKSMTPGEMSAMQAEIANNFRLKESGAVIMRSVS